MDEEEVIVEPLPVAAASSRRFMESEGKSKPDEYNKEGHGAAEVIDDIAGWMKKK